MDITADQVKAIILDPQKALDLTDDQFDAAMHAAIGLYGTQPQASLDLQLQTLYRHYVTRSHPAQRMMNYQGMADRVLAGDINPRALVPYWSYDPDLSIVSMAALDYAVLAPQQNDDPLSAVAELLDHYQDGLVVNGPALLGGLLSSGDRRVLARIENDCRVLSCDEIEELIRCRSRFLTAAIVEFYLEWLESLDSLSDEGRYGTVAAGLANLALSTSDSTVYELEWVIPSRPDNAVQMTERWRLAEFAAKIKQRMNAIACREEGEPIMPVVMEAWGIG